MMEKKWVSAMITAVVSIILISVTSCATVLKNADFDQQGSVYEMSKKLTNSWIKEKLPIKRIALVGFTDLAAYAGVLGDNKRLLNSAIKKTDSILADLQYDVVPVEQVLTNSVYQSIGAKEQLGWTWADGTKLMIGGGWGDYWISVPLEDVYKVITALNVDGVIAITTQFSGRDHTISYMSLYAKNNSISGQAKLIWYAELKKHSYDNSVNGIEQFTRAFQLLATRMKLDLDN